MKPAENPLVPKSDPRFVRDDSLWAALNEGRADADMQRDAAEWIEWAMAHIPRRNAERRLAGEPR
jgi:hypothetical protein